VRPAIGIDLGGTKIEAAILGDAGEILWRRRRPTPRNDYPGTLRAIAELVAEAEAAVGARGTVGVGHPGTIDPRSGLVKNANSVWLNGRPMRRDLAELLGRPVACANDANCLALSEATDGAAAGARVVFAIILGTGVGGGIVVEGRLLEGVQAIAGEWGHNFLPWPEPEEVPGPPCWCGLSGCIERWLSGPGLAEDHLRIHGERLTSEHIVERAGAGDARAEETLRRYEHRLARALASVINVLDPDVIVAGGGLSNVRRLYASVPRLWKRWVFSPDVVTRFVPARFGDSSGVRGAAWLGRDLAEKAGGAGLVRGS